MLKSRRALSQAKRISQLTRAFDPCAVSVARRARRVGQITVAICLFASAAVIPTLGQSRSVWPT
jgi:hypothetical protein